MTGVSRGIGRALVEEALARGAAQVYAGTRQPLEYPDGRVTQLILYITSPEEIQQAAGHVESLDILVNNAGVFLYDDLSDRAALDQHLAVNFYGTYDVTRAFLPALTRSRGRVDRSRFGAHTSQFDYAAVLRRRPSSTTAVDRRWPSSTTPDHDQPSSFRHPAGLPTTGGLWSYV